MLVPIGPAHPRITSFDAQPPSPGTGSWDHPLRGGMDLIEPGSAPAVALLKEQILPVGSILLELSPRLIPASPALPPTPIRLLMDRTARIWERRWHSMPSTAS